MIDCCRQAKPEPEAGALLTLSNVVLNLVFTRVPVEC
jgi:hypothetical protein